MEVVGYIQNRQDNFIFLLYTQRVKGFMTASTSTTDDCGEETRKEMGMNRAGWVKSTKAAREKVGVTEITTSHSFITN